MINYSADLHLHTNYSDGTFTPQDLIKKAKQLNFNAVSITDHDVVDAIPIAQKTANELDIDLIPGVELTIEWKETELHLLGYCIDWDVKWFKKFLNDICRIRSERMREMVKKLNNLGVNLRPEEVFSSSGRGAIGRLHLANVLHEKNIVSSPQKAFNKYIGDFGPCYVEKYKLTPEEGIDMISRLNGISVIAHPGISIDRDDIVFLVEKGLGGIEVYHPKHNKKQIEKYIKIADDYGLVITGGSDCHGHAKSRIFMGDIRLDKKIIDDLKSKKESIVNDK